MLKSKTIVKEETNKKNIKKYNYGLAILKSFLAFLVVLAHCFKENSTKNKIILFFAINRRFHVPSFFIMSFYFMCKNLLSLNYIIIKNRFIRLLIPYIGWTFLLWIINHVINKKLQWKLPDSYNDLKYQLLWGRGFLDQFWFQWNLIVITIVFIIILFIFRNLYLFILQNILILCYVIQYSGYHLNNFIVNYPGVNKTTIGFLSESIPYAVTGFTLKIYDILGILKKKKYKTLFLSILLYNIFSKYYIFVKIKGKNFHGIELNIKSLCIIFIFSLFPSEKISNKYLKSFLIMITNYSAGVFYLHISINIYMSKYIDIIKKGTFLGCIINYIICYLICFFGMLIFDRTPFKHLFC